MREEKANGRGGLNKDGDAPIQNVKTLQFVNKLYFL